MPPESLDDANGGSEGFLRQFDLPFTDRELYLAFVVTDEPAAAYAQVVDFRENTSRAREHFRALAAVTPFPDDAVVSAISHDTLAILANISETTAAKVERYLHERWPRSDEYNAQTYELFESRREQLRPVVQERLREFGLAPGDL